MNPASADSRPVIISTPTDSSRGEATVGSWLKEMRLALRLKRPVFVREVARLRPQASLSADYLAKIEGGHRSLGDASVDVREGLRLALRIDPDTWQQHTGLPVPAAANTAWNSADERLMRAQMLCNLLSSIDHTAEDIEAAAKFDITEYLNGNKDILDLPESKIGDLIVAIGLSDDEIISALNIPDHHMSLWTTTRPAPLGHGKRSVIRIEEQMLGPYAAPAGSVVIYDPNDNSGYQLTKIGELYYSMPSGTPRALGRILSVQVSSEK